MKFILYIFISLTTMSSYAQKEFSIGPNVSFLHNKLTGGIEFNLWKEIKRETYTQKLTFKVSYGLLGYKVHESKNNFKNYHIHEKFILVGLDISIIKQFQISNHFFMGIGSSWSTIENKSYTIFENINTGDQIKEFPHFNFQTISVISNFGYQTYISNDLIVKMAAQFFYFYPIGMVINVYEPIPNHGVEQDISISLNYLF